MADKIPFFPMTQIERDLVEFLQSVQGLPQEADFLQSLDNQEGIISYKQRIRLWTIPSKYIFPDSTPWPNKDIIATISFLIEAIESVHKSYWADRIVAEHKKAILRHLESIAQRRSDWLEVEMHRLHDVAEP